MTVAVDKPQTFTHSSLTWEQFKALQAAFAATRSKLDAHLERTALDAAMDPTPTTC